MYLTIMRSFQNDPNYPEVATDSIRESSLSDV